MKEIVIKENQEKELWKIEVDGDITIKLEWYYFSSEWIAMLHELWWIAKDECCYMLHPNSSNSLIVISITLAVIWSGT